LADVKRFLKAMPECDNNEEVAIKATNQYKRKAAKPHMTSPAAAPSVKKPSEDTTSPSAAKKPQANAPLRAAVTAAKATTAPKPVEHKQPLYDCQTLPKVPVSAFDFFKTNAAGDVSDPQELWAALESEEKKPYETKATHDLLRYWTEMEQYARHKKREAQSNLHIVVDVQNQSRKKRKRDKNAPKRAISAYNYFYKLHRENIIQRALDPATQNNNPDDPDYIDEEWMTKLINTESGKVNVQNVGRLVGQRWKATPSEGRTKYEEMAGQDQQRYNQEFEEYRANAEANPSTADDAGETPSKRKRSKKDENLPKRAKSAYNDFFKLEREKIVQIARGADDSDLNNDTSSNDYIPPEQLQKLRKENGTINTMEITKMIGQRWKAVTPEQMEYYNQLAEEDVERYNRETQLYNAEKEREGGAPAQETNNVVVVAAEADETRDESVDDTESE